MAMTMKNCVFQNVMFGLVEVYRGLLLSSLEQKRHLMFLQETVIIKHELYENQKEIKRKLLSFSPEPSVSLPAI
jgi:hypothetical protein